VREGYGTYYWADGSIYCKGRYVNGKEEDNWTYYTKNGQISHINVYKNGEYVRTINY
jgi:antitoxin component YwqK of YwqJK toxin-antitoxin module